MSCAFCAATNLANAAFTSSSVPALAAPTKAMSNKETAIRDVMAKLRASDGLNIRQASAPENRRRCPHAALLRARGRKATRAAIAGIEGTGEIIGYRGIATLASWGPLAVSGVNWGDDPHHQAERRAARRLLPRSRCGVPRSANRRSTVNYPV